jgi:aspartyl-tRNA(Asn)/glutamyl-tRNA(Gln) amidotransferase subunit C
MNITRKDIEKLAHLSRLELTEEELVAMESDMNKMLQFVDKINALNLEGIEPLAYMSDEVNVLRADEVKQDISHEDALKNAPDKDTDYFRVPKVMRK